MTRYERQVLAVVDGGFDVEGRIVEVLEAPRSGRSSVTALVEVPDKTAPTTTPAGDDPEGVSKQTWFCNEPKADDKPCQREVDERGEKCWQHEDE